MTTARETNGSPAEIAVARVFVGVLLAIEIAILCRAAHLQWKATGAAGARFVEGPFDIMVAFVEAGGLVYAAILLLAVELARRIADHLAGRFRKPDSRGWTQVQAMVGLALFASATWMGYATTVSLGGDAIDMIGPFGSYPALAFVGFHLVARTASDVLGGILPVRVVQVGREAGDEAR